MISTRRGSAAPFVHQIEVRDGSAARVLHQTARPRTTYLALRKKYSGGPEQRGTEQTHDFVRPRKPMYVNRRRALLVRQAMGKRRIRQTQMNEEGICRTGFLRDY